MRLDKRVVGVIGAAVVGLGFVACTEEDQREAGREIGNAAEEVREETRQAGQELREGAENVSEGVRESTADDERR